MLLIRSSEELYLSHVGTPHEGSVPHSGRYQWGSGENAYQRLTGDFLADCQVLAKKGMSEADIAVAMLGPGAKTTDLRAAKSIAQENDRAAKRARAIEIYNNQKKKNISAIGREMGLNESSVRSLLDDTIAENQGKNRKIAEQIRERIKEKTYVDVGKGIEYELGCTKNTLDTALAMLEMEGYKVYYGKVKQMGTQHETSLRAICPPDKTWKDFNENKFDLANFESTYNKDTGLTSAGIKPVVSLDSKRLMVRYGDEGGKERDGTIEIRRGVADISLGNSTYAQVRIAVDNKSYLKGVAVYSDNMPKGVDVIFNTNKSDTGDKHDALKPLKRLANGEVDQENPFGTNIKKQLEYADKDGKTKQSVINIVNHEGDWDDWSRTLASQFLSKQPLQVAKTQLELTHANNAAELEEIRKITNPTLKKKLLETYADGMDSKAVNLKAASFPRQSTKLLLPIPSLKDNEVYAPGYKDGEEIALVRFPHAGTFEIPKLKVNNSNQDAKRIITPTSIDAIGINSNVAERLSGADFDGDSVIVIPTKNVKIKSTDPLKALENFDPKQYKITDKNNPRYYVKEQTKQNEMGRISNLITDMTLKGADPDEIARAVKHSMVVIDAQKHHLDYRQSYKDNNISELKEKYQDSGGAGTLISRAKGEKRVDERKIYSYSRKGAIDPKTGEKIYQYTNREYEKKKKIVDPKTGEITYESTGVIVRAQDKSTRMKEAKDAKELLSKNPNSMELLYAKYANQCKQLANDARKEYLKTEEVKRDSSAAKAYAKEVKELDEALLIAQKASPKERQAQLLANKMLSDRVRDNPELKEDKEAYRKARGQALASARIQVGSKKKVISINEKQYEAIQSGAISPTKLRKILDNADLDEVRKMATPKQTNRLSSAKIAKIKAMRAAGFTLADIADAIGVSTSTVSNALKAA